MSIVLLNEVYKFKFCYSIIYVFILVLWGQSMSGKENMQNKLRNFRKMVMINTIRQITE